MIVPTIHLNGSNPQLLVEDLLNARNKLYDAIDALVKTAPNGRDFYPQGPDALKAATEEHDSRRTRLYSVYDELGQLAEAIQDAGD